MKVTMSQKTLLEAIKRGAFAALSDEAQTDSSTLSLLIKSVKIIVGKDEITFESATALVASRYVEPITDKIVVNETGTVMVPAKEIFDWVNRQGDCMIGLRSKDLDTPEMVNVVTGETDIASKAAIKKLGSLELASKDAKKTGSKWSLDSYDATRIPTLEDPINNPLFIAPLEQLNEGLKYTSFVALPKDTDHLYDTVSFQHQNNKMYIVTTDCARCAVWHVPNADKITMKTALTAEDMKANGMADAWKHNLLVPAKFLTEVCKLASAAAPLAFYRDENKNRIFISQPGFIVRMATAEKDMIAKFPPLGLFLVKKYKDLCVVPREILMNRLNTVSLVNKNAILFSFNSDQLILEGISESGHSPCKANVSITNLNEDFKQVWNVKHILDILKVLNDDNIKILIPKDNDKDSVKIVSSDHPNIEYYAMAVERSKYNLGKD
jgi:DNA polymerase III sliding clamp (beta) subunit (PCNA family)